MDRRKAIAIALATGMTALTGAVAAVATGAIGGADKPAHAEQPATTASGSTSTQQTKDPIVRTSIVEVDDVVVVTTTPATAATDPATDAPTQAAQQANYPALAPVKAKARPKAVTTVANATPAVTAPWPTSTHTDAPAPPAPPEAPDPTVARRPQPTGGPSTTRQRGSGSTTTQPGDNTTPRRGGSTTTEAP